jgi:hypothetical protein
MIIESCRQFLIDSDIRVLVLPVFKKVRLHRTMITTCKECQIGPFVGWGTTKFCRDIATNQIDLWKAGILIWNIAF